MIDVDRIMAIIRTAGGDGAASPAPTKKTRVYARQRFTMEPDDQGDVGEIDVIICSASRWRRMSSRKRYGSEFSVVSAGPVVVAVRVSR